jgi:hypothetical protein
LAKAAWWTGRQNESISARERAYAALVERGDRAPAAFAALTLRREYSAKLAASVANGWLNRAETLLGMSRNRRHGYLAIAHGDSPAARANWTRPRTSSSGRDRGPVERPRLRAWASCEA